MIRRLWRLGLRLSKVWRWVDTYIVDGIVNGVGIVTQIFAQTLRFVQTGRVQTYLAIIVIGLMALLAIGGR